MHLAAAGLPPRHIHVVPEPLEQVHGGLADLGNIPSARQVLNSATRMFTAWQHRAGPAAARWYPGPVAAGQLEIIAAGVSGDLAYTVGYEHETASMDGGPDETYTLRVTHCHDSQRLSSNAAR